MNSVDAVVGVLIALAALRGYWRGFFRELFGMLALAAGILAAPRWAGMVAAWLGDSLPMPDVVRDGVAFVAAFMVAYTVVNLAGLMLDRLASSLMLAGVNRVVGALLGAAKAGAVAAVVLLVIHLFPPLRSVDDQITASAVGRPLVTIASGLLHLGVPATTPAQGK
jgi:membrane protein required for colicin V production